MPALLSLQLVSESNGPHLVGPGVERHSDFYPVLEYIAERAFFVRRRTSFLEQFDERVLPRAGTLLGEYLRRHPLTVQDARSVVLLHTTATVPDPQIVRSVLRRWQEMAPEDVLPLEISSKMNLALPISELQALELGRSRDRILERAATDPEPLRMYSRHLMNAYRSLRSVFHTPPADELRTVLDDAKVDAAAREKILAAFRDDYDGIGAPPASPGLAGVSVGGVDVDAVGWEPG